MPIRNTVVVAPISTRGLPMPCLIPTQIPKTPAARAAMIEHVKEEAAAPRRGRATKTEVRKAERLAMSERIRGFLSTKPDKKDVSEYIKSRIHELAD